MSLRPESAMIFAAGLGTRMGNLTRYTPKPMLPLLDRPMIDYSVDLLRQAGVGRIVANTHYLHDRIAPHLQDLGVIVSREDPEILDTGGGLKAALSDLGPGPVVTLNPDAAWTGPNPVATLLEAWRPEMRALLLLVPLNAAHTVRDSGDFSLEQGKISRIGDYLYTGAQIIRTEGLSEISDRAFSLNRYWDRLALSGPLNGIVFQGQWCDIGHPEGLHHAERMLWDV